MSKEFKLEYRMKDGVIKEQPLDADNFFDAELEALKKLKEDKANINFNKKHNIKLILQSDSENIEYESIWKKISPLSNANDVGGYVEGFIVKYTKKEKKGLKQYLKKLEKSRLRILKPFLWIYRLVATLILIDMLLDTFIDTHTKKAWIQNLIGMEGLNGFSIILQTIFLLLLIIASYLQPIAYEDFRNNSVNWKGLKKKILFYETPALVSSVVTTISLIINYDNMTFTLFFGSILVLLVLKIIIAMVYEKESFYRKLKLSFHNYK